MPEKKARATFVFTIFFTSTYAAANVAPQPSPTSTNPPVANLRKLEGMLQLTGLVSIGVPGGRVLVGAVYCCVAQKVALSAVWVLTILGARGGDGGYHRKKSTKKIQSHKKQSIIDPKRGLFTSTEKLTQSRREISPNIRTADPKRKTVNEDGFGFLIESKLTYVHGCRCFL